jgi:phage-related protein
MDESQAPRPVLWVASAKRDLLAMPSDVIGDFGFGLYQAQIGEYPDIGKTLSGFGSANIIELVQDHKGDAFRAVYTVRFSEVIVVLHAFQKKSKKGSATLKQDIDLIHSRLKLAEELYKLWKKKKGGV